MIPVLVLAFYLLPMDVRYLAAAFVFSIASLTDWLDGHLARSMGQTTPFGAFLDPVADKLLVAVALILLVEVHARVRCSLSQPWLSSAEKSSSQRSESG